MNRRIFLVLLLLPFCVLHAQTVPRPNVKATAFRRDSFPISKFGAVNDGLTLNTAALAQAIKACAAKGGGVVVIPAGLWLTGPVEILSNVNLHLQKNAVLQFTDDHSQYPLVKGNWEGQPQMRNTSPLFASKATNIAITGQGIIDGNGQSWRMVKKDKLTETQWKKLVASGGIVSEDKKTWYPSEQTLKGSLLKNPGVIESGKTAQYFEEIKDFLRPNLLVFTSCKQVLLEGVTFQNSPAWCLHPLMCEDLTVRNVSVKNPWYAQNGDGIDVESCSRVLIENSIFDVGDDGICIKSGRDEAGRQRGMPTQDLWVRNCTVYAAHGGFVIGSEMSGGARNLYVDQCTFIGTDIGLRFKTTRGRGGIVENVVISNITMKDIVGDAILFDMYYAAQDPVPLSGEKREPPKVQTLPVSDATPQFRNFRINNVVCNGAQRAIFVRGLPEMNVQDVVLSNMVLQSEKGLDMTEATGFRLDTIRLVTKELSPVLNIHNSQGIVLNKITYDRADVLLNLTGDKTDRITLNAYSLHPATTTVQTGFGAKETAVRVLK